MSEKKAKLLLEVILILRDDASTEDVDSCRRFFSELDSLLDRHRLSSTAIYEDI